jgi:hypothetical protein
MANGTCNYPGCTRPVAPPPPTGGRSSYCDDPAHTAATAFQARRREARARTQAWLEAHLGRTANIGDDAGSMASTAPEARRLMEVLKELAPEGDADGGGPGSRLRSTVVGALVALEWRLASEKAVAERAAHERDAALSAQEAARAAVAEAERERDVALAQVRALEQVVAAVRDLAAAQQARAETAEAALSEAIAARRAAEERASNGEKGAA